MLPVAILAGGLATRLRPKTNKIPKSLLEIAGQPFIFYQLAWLKQQGIKHVVVCLGFLGEQIEAAVGNGKAWNLSVEYSFDGDVLRGTGGALQQALPLLGEHFFVLYGDSYLSCSLSDVLSAFEAAQKPALMTVLHNMNRWDKSNVLFKEGKILDYSKQLLHPEMAHIDYGLGILSAEAVSDFNRFATDQPFDLADLYRQLLQNNALAGFEVGERFYEIGSHQGIQETECFLLDISKNSNTRTGQFMSQTSCNYTQQHLHEAIEIIKKLDIMAIEKMASLLSDIKADGGRLFFLGVGGSAGNCSHAVNDFRKIVGIESYAPTDNVSELTARTNDEGWTTIFAEWLKTSRLSPKDGVFILSVGGGNLEKNISPNIVEALKYAKSVGARVTGIVGRDGGYTAQVADVSVIVPTVNVDTITPHTEAFQAIIWHLLVSHPNLKENQMKWESASLMVQ